MEKELAYDKKALIRYLVILGVFTPLSHFTRGYIVVLIPLFVLVALSRQKLVDLLFWTLLLVFTGAGNRYFFSQNAIVVLIGRACLMSVTCLLMFRAFGRRNAIIATPLLGIFAYIFWEAIVSAQGFSPIVSYLKIALFIPLFLSFYTIANEVTQSTRVNAKAVRSAILSISCLALIGSAMTIPFPGISQMTVKLGETDAAVLQAIAEGKSLFQGMTSHSQVMGPMVGILSTLIFGDLVFSVKRWDKLYLALLGVGPILLYKSSSRTAMGTWLAGMGLVALLFMHARGVNARWKGKVMSACVALSVLCGVALLSIPGTRDSLLRFVLKVDKRSDVSSSDVTWNRVTSSREGLVQRSLYNFRRKPLLGNGFQVSDDMANEKRTGLLSYLSAPIEKGVWPTAVLEEGGVVGLALFGGFLVGAIVLMVRRHAYIGASMLWVFSVANLGEFSFFSMSYIGGLYWGLVYAGVVLDGQRLKTVGLAVFEVPIEVVMEEVGVDMWTRRLA